MIGTSYYEVYKRALTEIKDPFLSKLLSSNPILFSETMYNLMVNAIPLFSNPIGASIRISDRVEPADNTENFTGDGTTDTFKLSNPPEPDLVEETIFSYKVDGVIADGEYDSVTESIKLTIIPPVDSAVEVEAYYIGNFNKILYPEEIYILSQFLVSCWAEMNKNDKLDIVRLLGDTDFKLTSNASTTQAKVEWDNSVREMAIKRMNKYSWDCVMNGRYR